MKLIVISCLLIVSCSFTKIVGLQSKPHIVFVLADDYGFNDIGYHGASHGSAIKTPFLDSLAMSGVRLENYYVQPACTPTRSQLMSGRYQIHTGLQHGNIKPAQPNGLGLENILLPEQLKNSGYDTHMVGKWHLGFYKDKYLPSKRGFDSYFGFLFGAEDHYTKYRCYKHMCGYSMHSNNVATNETYGEYSAHLYARKVKELVANHNKSNPMFLYVALQSVHEPLEVPDKYMAPYMGIKNKNRRVYAGMVAAMDEAVKNITEHLQKAGMWDNTLFVFSTDNGGLTKAGGNNWPLRGGKGTLWEGGVRGVGFVHGKMLNVPNPNVITNDQLIHVSDWYPTLLHAASCQAMPGTQSLDGFDQWNAIATNAASPRTEILHHIDPLHTLGHEKKVIMGFDTSVRAAIRVGDWKLLTGQSSFAKWVKPPELDFDDESLKANNPYFELLHQLYVSASESPAVQGDAGPVQLYNIKLDPFERNEVSANYPDIVEHLLTKLANYNFTAVPVTYPPIADPNANPDLHDGFWKAWKK